MKQKKKNNVDLAIAKLSLLTIPRIARVIRVLEKKPNTTTGVTKVTKLWQPDVSRSLGKLYKAGIVTKMKDEDGVRVWYNLDYVKLAQLEVMADQIMKL